VRARDKGRTGGAVAPLTDAICRLNRHADTTALAQRLHGRPYGDPTLHRMFPQRLSSKTSLRRPSDVLDARREVSRKNAGSWSRAGPVKRTGITTNNRFLCACLP
jgi:hypothetical protein